MSSERKGGKTEAGKTALAVIKGSGTGIVFSLAVLLAGAGLIWSGGAGEERSGVIALLAAFLGCFAGGMVSALIVKKRVLPVAAAAGGVQLLVWCLVGLIPVVNGVGELLKLALVCLTGGALSGLAAAGVRKGKR